MKSSNAKQLYEQVESIKSTLNLSDGAAIFSDPESMIQLQNLQDLYHEIILSDIDFTIDKKIEQDLWNVIFKGHITYLQSQLRENGTSVVGGGVGGGNANLTAPISSASGAAASNMVSKSVGVSKTLSAHKRMEAQVNLVFFLQSARGFYTKLLEDLVSTYEEMNNTRLSLPFIRPVRSIFDNINAYGSLPMPTKPEEKEDEHELSKSDQATMAMSDANKKCQSGKEKQLMYICQHVLTHLGDIARYEKYYDQAELYYMHAIRLVPYLGQPYNQLGILFEMSRVNQLATVFYYVRSVSVRCMFPLALNNLESYFKKLKDIPLARYNPTWQQQVVESENSSNAPVGATSASIIPIKLAYKDLISLYLQINGIIYLSTTSNPDSSNATGNSSYARLSNYLDLFKHSFTSFLQTPLQRDKLDIVQMCQMIAIMLFMLNQQTNHKLNSSSSSSLLSKENELIKSRSSANLAHLFALFSYFIELFVNTYNEAKQLEKKTQNNDFPTSSADVSSDVQTKTTKTVALDELVLPSFYILLCFIQNYQDSKLFTKNRLWITGALSSPEKCLNESFCRNTLTMLNSIHKELESEANKVKLERLDDFLLDYPLKEDRMLDSFLPLKHSHESYDFAKYMASQSLSGTEETLLRKKRILMIIEHMCAKSCAKGSSETNATPISNKSSSLIDNECFIALNQETSESEKFERFLFNQKLIDFSLEASNITPRVKDTNSFSMKEASSLEQNQSASPSSPQLHQHQHQQQQQQQQRKKRQNVAISSLTQQNKMNQSPPHFQQQEKENQQEPSPISNQLIESKETIKVDPDKDQIRVQKFSMDTSKKKEHEINSFVPFTTQDKSLNYSSNLADNIMLPKPTTPLFARESLSSQQNLTFHKQQQQQQQQQKQLFFPSASFRQLHKLQNHQQQQAPNQSYPLDYLILSNQIGSLNLTANLNKTQSNENPLTTHLAKFNQLNSFEQPAQFNSLQSSTFLNQQNFTTNHSMNRPDTISDFDYMRLSNLFYFF
jgi:hypothetical protein